MNICSPLGADLEPRGRVTILTLSSTYMILHQHIDMSSIAT